MCTGKWSVFAQTAVQHNFCSGWLQLEFFLFFRRSGEKINDMRTYNLASSELSSWLLTNKSTLADFVRRQSRVTSSFQAGIFVQVQLLQPRVFCHSSEEILSARRGWGRFCDQNFSDLHHRRQLWHVLWGDSAMPPRGRELQPPPGRHGRHRQQEGKAGELKAVGWYVWLCCRTDWWVGLQSW